MTPQVSRWQDIVLNPCNKSVERRNVAAIREALQALAEQQAEPTETPGSSGGGTQLIFFKVQADAVGSPSVAVKEMIYDSGGGTWGDTGADYTAYDWSGRDQWSVNFRTGALGVGRIATDVAQDALEILSLEGLARVIQVTLKENMGATTTKQASCDVVHFWGDTVNGMDPGAVVTIHDHTNMAPAALLGTTALAIFDEKRQQYVMIAPWNGNQTPGTTAIVQISGGDVGLGCDDSVEEDSYCLYQGNVVTVALPGDLCSSKFNSSSAVWVVDGRNCHGTPRLGHQERYIAISTGVTFDPDPGGLSSDERTVYVTIDYAPSFRWFRILTDVESLVLESAEVNDMKCREHDCGGEDKPDDCPSTWGKWSDIDPCTRVVGTIDTNPVLIYFPRYRSRCKPEEERDERDGCLSKDSDPDCRKNEYILAWWNPIAERWEAVMDAEKCESKADVSLIVICNKDAYLDCCLYDALRVTIWPRDDAYCDPIRDIIPVWARCTNGQLSYQKGACELGVRICDSLVCQDEDRPVYLIKCGPCDPCECPSTVTNVVRFKFTVANPEGPCGYIGEVKGEMFCLDQNPFETAPALVQGWYAHFSVIGVTPRLLYFVEPNDIATYPDGVWLEIACGGEEGFSDGEIIAAYDEFYNPKPIPVANDYASGILECQHMQIFDPLTGTYTPQYRARTYNYGLWAECPGDHLVNFKMYVLKHDLVLTPVNPACSDDGAKGVVFADQVISDTEGLTNNPDCCHNWERICLEDIYFGCKAGTEIPIPDLGGALSGETNCSPCAHTSSTHILGGCPCDWIVTAPTGPPVCVTGSASCPVGPFPSVSEHRCCSHPDNQICIEFEWPFTVDIP